MEYLIRSGIPFLLFFISGFCGLLYQVVWLRLGFRAFGVITPVLSVVISVFMLGLAIGSWLGGIGISRICRKTRIPPLTYYAVAELLIGASAFMVPRLFGVAERYLLGVGEMDSLHYLVSSALLMAASILPWCVCMGVTFPFMMAHIRAIDNKETTSFSFLYLANVLGAMCGTLLTALVLIEMLGFHSTLMVAGIANLSIAGIAGYFAVVRPVHIAEPFLRRPQITDELERRKDPGRLYRIILFTTGFTSMGMEVVWIRAFTPVLQTTVYSFASILATYLAATWYGSTLYRRDLARGIACKNGTMIAWLGPLALLPVVLNDPRFSISPALVLLTIFPFCMALGYLTPKVVDDYSKGSEQRAGTAYAINIGGSILGPLFSSYVLLPGLGTRYSMILLGMPFLLLLGFLFKEMDQQNMARYVLAPACCLLLLFSILFSLGYEERFGEKNFARDGLIRRDHTATIISVGDGMEKRLFVNGISITHLTPITQIMGHLPLVHLQAEPENALVICFGMGTSYRALMSWPIDVTAVELVPSVREAFDYYFQDARELLSDPRSQFVVDDGRRFLKRTRRQYDVITIDPPPPVEAAGSSFLYSRNFYDTVKARLKPGGILHHWLPGGDTKVFLGVASALVDAFDHVKMFRSIEGWGFHFLASSTPMPVHTVSSMLESMPSKARANLHEWLHDEELRQGLALMFSTEKDVRSILPDQYKEMITDDLPLNEYFLLRRGWGYGL